MEKIVDVQINKANALITLGSMYRSAADAIKEYVSNALDEWAIARSEGRGEEQCRGRLHPRKEVHYHRLQRSRHGRRRL